MAKNIRRTYWLVNAFLKKHFVKIILSTLLTVIALIIIPPLAQHIPTGKPTIKIGRVGQFTTNNLPSDIQHLISSGLTDISEDGSATPSLALKWEVEDNGQTYRFYLNPNKTWHNGELLQAADINYELEDVKINILDSQTVEFKLKEPFAPFPTALSTPLFRRTKILSKILKRSKSQLIGIGSYQVKSIKYQGQYINQLLLESAEEKRLYKFYPTQEASILGFKLGETNRLENLSSPEELSQWKNITIEETTHPNRYVAVFFNTQDAMLTDKNYRQALTYAISKTSDETKRALGPISPNSWAFNHQIKEYLTDNKKAKELLDKLSEDSNEKLDLSIRLDTNLAYLEEAEKIKQSWEALGIKTEVRVVPFPDQEFQALLAVYQAPPDPDQYTLWHSTQTTNITKIKNPKIDKLLEDGRKTIDRNERTKIYQDFQRFLLEESPAAFLFHQSTYTVSRN